MCWYYFCIKTSYYNWDMERFIRRGWTTGMAQESNMCGIFPCLLFWFVRNTTAYRLGPNRLPFPQLKSSMIQPSFNWHSHLNFESLKTKYICTVSQKSWMNRWLGSYSSRIGQIHWPTLLLPIHWMNEWLLIRLYKTITKTKLWDNHH